MCMIKGIGYTRSLWDFKGIKQPVLVMDGQTFLD